MVLNANQQQNLLDLLAGKTNSINPEVPIVEDTMVDNPLDVLANMNKQSMADGGTAIPDSIRRPNYIEELMNKILNRPPDPNLTNPQTPPPPDMMLNDNTNPPTTTTTTTLPPAPPVAAPTPPPTEAAREPFQEEIYGRTPGAPPMTPMDPTTPTAPKHLSLIHI